MESVKDRTYGGVNIGSMSNSGTFSAAAVYLAMKPERIILAAAMLTATGTAALAQQNLTGMVTVLDRLQGSVTIRHEPSGAGDNAGSTAGRYKAPVKLLENVHAGDKVRFSVTEANNTRTITKIEVQ